MAGNDFKIEADKVEDDAGFNQPTESTVFDKRTMENFLEFENYLINYMTRSRLSEGRGVGIQTRDTDEILEAITTIQELVSFEAFPEADICMMKNDTWEGLLKLKKIIINEKSKALTNERPIGRPQCDGLIAVAIYSVLRDIRKSTKMKETVKTLIIQGGTLQRKIDKHLGEGTFDCFGIPNVSLVLDRWEKSVLETSKRRASDYIASVHFQDEPGPNEISPDERFEHVVKHFRYFFPIQEMKWGGLIRFDSQKFPTGAELAPISFVPHSPSGQ